MGHFKAGVSHLVVFTTLLNKRCCRIGITERGIKVVRIQFGDIALPEAADYQRRKVVMEPGMKKVSFLKNASIYILANQRD